ncbi:unnamed protein product [Amoebophrya sp. A25]|nr:unnamed protein product [Amoebophrya sp. A25]|eukprot:GSA25T00000241001.1
MAPPRRRHQGGRGFIRDDLELVSFLRDRKERVRAAIRTEEQEKLFSVNSEGLRFRIIVPESRASIRRKEREREAALKALMSGEDGKPQVKATEYFDMMWRKDLLETYHTIHSGKNGTLRSLAGWTQEGTWKGVQAVLALRPEGGNFLQRTRADEQQEDEELDAEDRDHLAGANVREAQLIRDFSFVVTSGGNSQDIEHNNSVNQSKLAETHYALMGKGMDIDSLLGGSASNLNFSDDGLGGPEDGDRILSKEMEALLRSEEMHGPEGNVHMRASSVMGKEPHVTTEFLGRKRLNPDTLAEWQGLADELPPVDAAGAQFGEEDDDEVYMMDDQGNFVLDAEGQKIPISSRGNTPEGVTGDGASLSRKDRLKQQREKAQAMSALLAGMDDGDKKGGAAGEEKEQKRVIDPTMMEPTLERPDYVLGIFDDPLGLLKTETLTRWQHVSVAAKQEPSLEAYQEVWRRLQEVFTSLQLNVIADLFLANYIQQLDQLQRQGSTKDAEKLSYAWMDLSTLSTVIPFYLKLCYPKADLLSPVQAFKEEMMTDVLRIVFADTPGPARKSIRRVHFELACVIIEVARMYWLQYAQDCAFDAAETGELHEIFHSFDQDDHDSEGGGLRAERIFDVLERAGFVLQADERVLLNDLYRMCDMDGNGFIDFVELLYILRRFQDKRLMTQVVHCKSQTLHLPLPFVEEFHYLLEIDARAKATDHDIVSTFNLFDLREILQSFDFPEAIRRTVQRFEIQRLEQNMGGEFTREEACKICASVYDQHDEGLLQWAQYLADKEAARQKLAAQQQKMKGRGQPAVEVELTEEQLVDQARAMLPEDMKPPEETRPPTFKEMVDMWAVSHCEIQKDELKFRKYLASSAWVQHGRRMQAGLMKAVSKRNWLAARMKGKKMQREMDLKARAAEQEILKQGTMQQPKVAASMKGMITAKKSGASFMKGLVKVKGGA